MVTAMNILTPPTSFIFEDQKANSQKQGKKKKKFTKMDQITE